MGAQLRRTNGRETTDRLPRVVSEIKPHPHGIQLGSLQRMLRKPREKMTSFLRHNFSGVNMRAAEEILAEAGLDEEGAQEDIRDDDTRND